MVQSVIPTISKVALLLLILGGCFSCSGNFSKSVCDVPPRQEAEESVPPPTADLMVDVYLDATSSMEGFVVDGSLSQYQQTIPMLERAVIRTGGKVAFFKFGTDIAELGGRSYGDAGQRTFYRDGSINRKTMIEKVIDRAGVDKLTIIATDLFQEKADINQLTDQIKTKYLSTGRAVGILGVRSAFRGKIFDVGINNYSFDYASSAEPKTLRPFYLVALGNPSDISKYFRVLVSGEMSSFPELHQVIISRHLGNETADWSKAKITETKGVNEVNGVLVPSIKGDRYFREFRVKEGAAEPRVTVALPFDAFGETAIEGLEGVSEYFPCGDGAKPATTVNGTNAIQNVSGSLSGNQISVTLTIDPRQLNKDFVSGYRTTLRPAGVRMPGWVVEWNMSGDQVEASKGNPMTFDGGRTYNLLPFLETLWEANRSVNNPKLAEFYTFLKLG